MKVAGVPPDLVTVAPGGKSLICPIGFGAAQTVSVHADEDIFPNE